MAEIRFEELQFEENGERVIVTFLENFYFETDTAILKEAGIDLVLVGDSVGNVLLGHKNTLPVTMSDMLHHTSAVCRAGLFVPVIGDMPNGSYSTPQTALRNAKKFLAAGAGALKVEGAVIKVVKKLVQNSVPVMGHVGLTPQTILDWKVQGKDEQGAKKILQDAIALDEAGCFSIVIESVPAGLAKKITESVKAPTIGIGAGPHCDGQVLVINDLLGFNAGDFKPRFVKQ
ncbi:3-methyl-2-oxobutanoate hydroxymethyltransferase, partial [Candidatus Woesearchaeota archaeon]|nr:3-methyl-2-oxobutanoate hydroxymethyltransferase [Candidatus Woesearchaeota archaeon]